MQGQKRTFRFPKVDFITVLIILVFIVLTLGVFLYYKQRINTIQSRIRQSRALIRQNRHEGREGNLIRADSIQPANRLTVAKEVY
jgi:hypothetical protein